MVEMNGSRRARSLVLLATSGIMGLAWAGPAPTGALSPAVIETPARVSGPIATPHAMRRQTSIILCDQMAIVDIEAYDIGNGNAISGAGAFNGVVDIQTADDCATTATYELDRVCVANMQFNALSPATGVWLQIYPDTAGVPAAAPTFAQVIAPADVQQNVWGRFLVGLTGVTTCANVSGLTLPAGTWWFSIQPVDTTSTGDWYYVLRDRDSLIGGDTYARDGATSHGGAFGGPYPGDYGVSDWTAMGSLGYGVGDSAFLVTAKASPVR